DILVFSSAQDITELLRLARDPANQQAREDLYRVIEAELRRIAHARHAEQPLVRSLCTTELIHDVWIRLVGKVGSAEDPRWKDRRHFFATASLVVQILLVDHVRKLIHRPVWVDHDQLQHLPDRGSGRPEATIEQAERFLALHEALNRLEQSDPNAAE